MEYLLTLGVKLHIKLHVKDSVENYSEIMHKIVRIDSFDDAIFGNICIARKSTVLLEALYNHSTSIAVILTEEDQSLMESGFPSLNDPKIKKANSLEQLGILVKSTLKLQ